MKNLIILIFTISVFASCAPTITIVDTSCPGYKSPGFNRADIEAKGIIIMPVLGGNEKEQFRRPMGDALVENFRNEFGYSNVKSPKDAIRILNSENLADEYAEAIAYYNTTGIVPKEMVNKLGLALNVDYLLYTKLLADAETRIISNGNSTELLNLDELYIQCQVWDTNIGDVVWEGKGGVAKTTNNYTNIIDQTAKGLSKIIGNEISDGPCQTKQVLVSSAEQANSSSNWAWFGLSLLLLIPLL